jgi:5,8-dihydroxy-2-naphthoate synthase
MWVNRMTLDYGANGRLAVERLLSEGHKQGVIPHPVQVDFLE